MQKVPAVKAPAFRLTTSGTGPESLGRDQAGIRVSVLVLVVVLLAVGGAALWYFRNAKAPDASNDGSATNSIVLSESSRAILNHLDAPVEIRFYSMLDRATVPAATFAFVERVNRLLLEFELAGNGKINLVRHGSLSNTAADAAAADDIKPFNLDKGNACYLGLAVACNDQRESLPELSPRWEPALEFDLSRAIEHVARPKSSPITPPAADAQADAAAAEDVRRAIPDLASVSVGEGTRMLREAALKEFKAAAQQMQAQVQEAQQRLSQVQSSGSEAEQQAAMKHVQQLQLDQAEKLKQIAGRLQAQIAALKQLKGE